MAYPRNSGEAKAKQRGLLRALSTYLHLLDLSISAVVKEGG
jgi:hypothetical protein